MELDNKLPRWWVWLFHICNVFAVVYLLYFHVFRIGDLSGEKFAKEIASARSAFPAVFETMTVGDESEQQPAADEAVLVQGKEIFMANCVACHGPDGGGLIGPNMCDDYYIHGPTFADSLRTIINGVPAKGMIAWKTMLKPADIEAVASYVWTLRGTTPANPKAPEGEPYPSES
jgi:cytochrome c oxidase cbb3-type subunit 3